MDFSKLRKSMFWNKKADRVVAVLDTNQDGCITRSDFLTLRERYSKQNVSAKGLETFIQHQDALLDRINLQDMQAKLTYDQFKKYISTDLEAELASGSDRYKRLFESMFRTIDLDDDGFISIEEWKSHYRVIGIDQKFAKASFDAMDRNKNGSIDIEEFVAFNYEYFCTTENTLGSEILYGPLD